MRKTENDLFEKLYKDNYRRIYLYIFSICKNEDIAKDLTQETFVKALLTLSDTHLNPVAWLYKVANNLVIDEYRRIRKFTDSDEIPEAADGLNSVAEQYIKNEQYRQLYNALDTLDETEKRIIVLYYFSGLSQKDIAAAASLSFANVRVKLTRAKQKLKNILSEEHI